MQLSHRAVTLALAAPFRISRSTDVEVELLWVELAHDGVSGFGEATPQDHYGESVASATAFLERAAPLLGDDPFAHEEIGARLAELPGERAAKCALDAALHDLCGKLCGQPVWRLLGVPRAAPPTSFTVWLGDPDDMAARAARVAAEGRFRRLKLKLGARDGLDVERVRAVRAVTGLPLQVDVNEYWTVDEALDAIPELAALGVEYVEQPLPAGDRGGALLRERSPLPVYLDEDCHTLADVAGCAERGHGVNIKLAKSGGIREAIRMVHAARALGLGVMIGCMIETGLGIAPACPVASLCDHVDLDGNLLLAHDPWPGVELEDGVQLPSDRPGLGVVAA
ncbi:MAG: dipeptide epimerase [Thermoleophilia bacterium]|nr:dipeptide epimerase [Thermoleophilia bacterium]